MNINKELRTSREIVGVIRDISSDGVYFLPPEILTADTKVELRIDWPVPLDGGSRLQLKGLGRVVRSDEHGTAIAIERHEFCTRKAQTAAPQSATAAGG